VCVYIYIYNTKRDMSSSPR